MSKIKIVLSEGVTLPKYATELSAGFDLSAYRFEQVYKGTREVDIPDVISKANQSGSFTLRGGERILINTGIKVQLEKGYELQIRSRSGLSLKSGIIVVNSPGTIDADYTGFVKIILGNTNVFPVVINLGDRIAQAVLGKYEVATFDVVDSLEQTSRGEGGFGHTGKN